MEITVVGVGYVGAVAAACLAAAGHRVVGIDTDPDRVNILRSGALPFYEPGLEEIVRSAIADGCLEFAHGATFDQPVGDVALIAVGTPQAPDGSADLCRVRAALSWVVDRRRSGALVVMKSTVPPGTGRHLIERYLAGTDLRYVANPEFLRQGRAVHDWQHPDRIVIGASPGDAGSVAAVKSLYAGTRAPFVVTDVTTAEMIKYAANAFLATRVSFINEIASLCDRVGASVNDVSTGLALDPRTGGRMYAGLGYGGSCLPKDLGALHHLGMAGSLDLELLRAVIKVNDRQRLLPLHALRERFGDLTGVPVAVLGLAFKPGTDDVREAPGIDLIRDLVAGGACVAAYDPQASDNGRDYLPLEVRIAATPQEAAAGARAIVLATEWDQCVNVDWPEIANLVRRPCFLFDGRNALDAHEIERHGFHYIGIGEQGHAQYSPPPCASE